MPEEQVRPSRRRPSSWSLPVAVTATVIGALLLAALLIAAFSRPVYDSWTPWAGDRTIGLSDLVKLALAVVAGIGAAQGLVVVYRRQRSLEADDEGKRAVEAGQRDQRRLMTERFGAASEQLGSAQAPVRLAGVYALSALADEWEDQRQQCIDVLCGYLRLPRADEGASDTLQSVVVEHLPSEADSRHLTETYAYRPGEQQVRLAIVLPPASLTGPS